MRHRSDASTAHEDDMEPRIRSSPSDTWSHQTVLVVQPLGTPRQLENGRVHPPMCEVDSILQVSRLVGRIRHLFCLAIEPPLSLSQLGSAGRHSSRVDRLSMPSGATLAITGLPDCPGQFSNCRRRSPVGFSFLLSSSIQLLSALLRIFDRRHQFLEGCTSRQLQAMP